MTTSLDERSIKSLIAELAHLEDQVRTARHTPQPTAAGTPTLSPDVIAILHRERDIIASLRRRQAQANRFA